MGRSITSIITVITILTTATRRSGSIRPFLTVSALPSFVSRSIIPRLGTLPSSTFFRRWQQHQHHQQQTSMSVSVSSSATSNHNSNEVPKQRTTPKDDARAYESFVSSSVDIRSAYVRDGAVTLVRSVRDVDYDTRRLFLYRVPLPTTIYNTKNEPYQEEQQRCVPPPPVEIPSKVRYRIPSPSGRTVAVFLEEPAPSSQPQTSSINNRRVIEVWTNGGHTLSNRIVLPSTIHGPVCFDTEWFGGFSFSPNEQFLVYVAEPLCPQTASFFSTEEASTAASTNPRPPAATEGRGIGDQNVLGKGKGEDWGEKYTTTHRLSLYIVHLASGRIGLVKHLPGADTDGTTTTTEGGYVLGQPVFSPCGTRVVYTGWDAGGGGQMPRRLGSIYCYQRPSKIYASVVTGLLECLADDGEGRNGGKEDGENDGDGDGDGFVCLTPNDRLARSPRFSSTFVDAQDPSSDTKTCKLMYLCHTRGFDTHGGVMGLHTMEWDLCNDQGPSLESRRELVPPIYDVASSESENDPSSAFPGLFLNRLPDPLCTSPDGRYLYTTTDWGCCTRIVRISIDDGTVSPLWFDLRDTEIDDDGSAGNVATSSQTLLCLTNDGDGVVSQSTPGRPPVIGFLPSSIMLGDKGSSEGDNDDGDNNNKERTNHEPSVTLIRPIISFGPVAAASKFPPLGSEQAVASKENEPECVRIKASANGGPEVEGILLLPPPSAHITTESDNGGDEQNHSMPLLVMPHGGPHGCSTTAYSPTIDFLCRYGKYAILLPNFRGSTGYGQTFLERLPGNIGRADVDDVVALTRAVLAFRRPSSSCCIDPERVGVCGGSHGGFLSGHLIGQFPELYKVAAMRNMVGNVAGMVTPTDIPDWCYVEGVYGVNSSGDGDDMRAYDWERFRGPTKDELGKMWDASPIAHIDKVVAPTLIAVGMADKRVPPSQSFEYYHTLRSKGVETKLLVYDKDDHAIDRVASEADHWINIKRWFDEHLL